ncbi:THOC5 family protein [Colletotrichum tofieldiae]|nr:THOC5 family protein [Colletotrichum tofieldiae]
MAVNDLVSDKKLGAVLQTSGYAQDQALRLLQLLSDIARAEEASATVEQLQATLSKEQKLLLTNISHLRGLHRSANFDARDTKAQTAEARHEVDRLHLQLQNLYYEQRHLEGEIEACESYEYVVPPRWRGGWAPSHPVDEFVALHPEHAADDENAMMIARIGHERAEREALEQQRLELVGRKQKLIADNKKRKDDLANLDKDLEKFIDARNPSKNSSRRLSELFRSTMLRSPTAGNEIWRVWPADHRQQKTGLFGSQCEATIHSKVRRLGIQHGILVDEGTTIETRHR